MRMELLNSWLSTDRNPAFSTELKPRMLRIPWWEVSKSSEDTKLGWVYSFPYSPPNLVCWGSLKIFLWLIETCFEKNLSSLEKALHQLSTQIQIATVCINSEIVKMLEAKILWVNQPWPDRHLTVENRIDLAFWIISQRTVQTSEWADLPWCFLISRSLVGPFKLLYA